MSTNPDDLGDALDILGAVFGDTKKPRRALAADPSDPWTSPLRSIRSPRTYIVARCMTPSFKAEIPMKKIEIHGVTEDGKPYRLNEFRAANAEVRGRSDDGKAYEALRARAQADVLRWQKLYPNDMIKVVEV